MFVIKPMDLGRGYEAGRICGQCDEIVARCANAFACAFGVRVRSKTRPSSVEFYDACTIQVTTFAGMVGCGEQQRAAYCVSSRADPACGTMGNAVAAYANSLVALIDGKQFH